MKKTIALCLGLLVLCVSGTYAGPAKFGVGAFGGVNIPIVQDDQSSGSIFGFKVRYQVIPILTLEPNISFSSYGSPDAEDFEYDVDGSSVTSYGLDVTLGNPVGKMGFKPYFVVGLGFYNQKNDQIDDVFGDPGSQTGLSGGVGFGVGFSPQFDIDIRGQAHIAGTEGDASRKSLALTAGLNYYFGAN
ncbi:outer membrane beta-barrel protein [candidate division GN15 bacterium]|nr:outer membrane beta-barrel protein [candidate division GN15 bacterium]